MPAHNALPYLDEAIESILGQTFTDFELVILDDASTDGTGNRLEQWIARDPRIRLLKAERQLGPVGSSNLVAREARATLVARMDADDISYPNRFGEQVQLLRENTDVGLVASLCDVIDANGRNLRGPEKWRLLRKSPMAPFAHGAIMYRRSVFDNVGGYRAPCEFWEDQDLIARIARVSRILVSQNVLYAVRQTSSSTRALSKIERLEEGMNLMYRCMDRLNEGRLYGDLLATDVAAGKLDPRVFIAIGSTALWAGKRPRLLNRLLERGDLGMNVTSVAALTWTAWASLSPSTLRFFLGRVLRIRNFAARSKSAQGPVSWCPLLARRGR